VLQLIVLHATTKKKDAYPSVLSDEMERAKQLEAFSAAHRASKVIAYHEFWRFEVTGVELSLEEAYRCV